jgi:hypothetical protein
LLESEIGSETSDSATKERTAQNNHDTNSDSEDDLPRSPYRKRRKANNAKTDHVVTRRSPRKKKKRSSLPAKEKVQEAPSSTRKKAPTNIKYVSPTEDTEVRRNKYRWHRSYMGALAYAVLKAKSWSINHPDYLDVTLENRKKLGGSVYDWDIVWLGLKVIHNEVLKFTGGINSLRKMLKTHATISQHLSDWRKSRTADENELKELFKVKMVTSKQKLDEFMLENREWTEEEEKELLRTCTERASKNEVTPEEESDDSDESFLRSTPGTL